MTIPHSDEARRYRILEVVGEGGFGMVYRARLEGAEGFAKDVAIKLLTDADAPEEVLQRFRDESRILGLIRDRAIVTVDPPTRLDGRWAVVMEFVDGTNCQRLMRQKPVPPRPALEIVQEVARALDNVYAQAGPSGEPLKLVHRDLKPSNLQITPAGAVKILDFGIARAQFTSREAKTTTAISGTFGYMAPERLDGVNEAPGDVYSLGVVLGALIAGRRTTKKNAAKIRAWVDEDPNLQTVWKLVDAMTAADPDDRPTAREVEDRCAEIGPGMPGGSLRRWAEREVTEVEMSRKDDLLGSVLTETMAHVPNMDAAGLALLETERTKERTRTRWLAVTVLVGGLMALLGVGGLAGVVGFIAGGAEEGTSVAVPAEPVPVEPVPAEPVVQPVPTEPVVEPVPTEPEAVEADSPAPTPVQPEPVRAPSPVPSPAVAKPVVPVPKPSPRPKPEPVRTFDVTFGSVPLGASISIDGTARGKVPLTRGLSAGTHRITMEYNGATSSKTITVGKRSATKYIWRGGETWQPYY